MPNTWIAALAIAIAGVIAPPMCNDQNLSNKLECQTAYEDANPLRPPAKPEVVNTAMQCAFVY
jgi:hypothetical protein